VSDAIASGNSNKKPWFRPAVQLIRQDIFMSQSQPSQYLESKIMTASPAQLHLMLIEGAIRFCNKAEHDLKNGNEGFANEALVRAIEIVAEMLAGVRHSDDEINVKLADLYQFLFNTLTSAFVNTDTTKLSDVLRILQFERETWQLACERVGAEEQSPPTVKNAAAKTPIVATPHSMQQNATSGLSLEA